jgi:hypothetical protein
MLLPKKGYQGHGTTAAKHSWTLATSADDVGRRQAAETAGRLCSNEVLYGRFHLGYQTREANVSLCSFGYGKPCFHLGGTSTVLLCSN